MISHEQHIEKIERVKKVIDTFLSYEEISINELSKILDMKPSTVQRDLNNIEYITLIYGTEAKEILSKISNKLKKNKNLGLIKGGTNSTKNNEPLRDENGKFIGNKKR